MWQLAIRTMLGDRSKLLVSLLGVAFSVALVNLQGGLLVGLIRKASQLVDHGGADIWVGHKHMSNLDIGGFVPERWVHRLRKVDGVERADPYVVMFSQVSMRDGRFENVMLVGCEPSSLLGNAWRMAEGDPRAILGHPEGILVDRCDLERLGNCKVGDFREIGGHRARVVGMTDGITGFTTNPYVFTTLERVRTQYAVVPPGQCSYFLIKAKPGMDITELCARLQKEVPELDVRDRTTYSRMCMAFWLTRTGVGISFGLAACLGLLVGLAVVGQTLHASVAERIKEFATLKALGADQRSLGRFIFVQALANAGLGSLAGLAGSVLIKALISGPRSPVELTVTVGVLSVVLVTCVCLLATWMPCRHIRRIDPASVLRG